MIPISRHCFLWGFRLCLLFATAFCGMASFAGTAPSAYQLANFHHARGQWYEQQRRLPEAAGEYQQAITYQPNWTELYVDLAWVWRDEGRSHDAEMLLREAVRRYPKAWDCYYGIGTMLLEQGRDAEALAPYLKSVQLNPNQWMGYRQLCGVYGGVGQWHQCLQSSLTWISRQPNSAAAHDAAGSAYGMLGDDRRSAAECRIALKFDPNDPMAHDNLGCALARQGHRAEAHVLWQWVLAHADNSHESQGSVADVRQMLVKYP